MVTSQEINHDEKYRLYLSSLSDSIGACPAHDVWITGKQAENNVIAEIGYGHNFPSKGTIPDRRDFFETPRLYNGKETITLKPTSTDYVYKIESAGNGNSYVLSTKMKPGYWSRTSSGWKPVSREGRNDVAYCEFVTKYAKSFILVNSRCQHNSISIQ